MNTVRIIGGIYKGKKIHFPSIEGLRPTADRVKETLFNWLMHDIRDAKCLDAFAGSGNLGLEAFSRGAKQVVFLENNRKAYENLRRLITTFNSEKLILYYLNTLKYIETSNEVFDIIFLDPPFAKEYYQQCLQLLSERSILKKGGLVYIESSLPIDLNESLWEKIKTNHAGQVIFELYRKL